MSEKSCKASGPAGTGPLGAGDLSGQRAPGREAVADRPRLFAVSESARSSRDIADAVARVGCGTGPIRISATDGVAETGWVAHKCQAHLSTLYGRRADGMHEAPHEGGGPSPCVATRGHGPQPAVEHGLHERTGRRWSMVPNSDRRRSVHP